MNPRDCAHGHLARSCEICELEATIAELEATIAELRARVTELETQLDFALAQRDAAHGFMAYYLFCPCCEETETCLDGCTFRKDCPDEARVMAEAREAMQGGEAR